MWSDAQWSPLVVCYAGGSSGGDLIRSFWDCLQHFFCGSEDGGPPPLRNALQPEGLTGLSVDNAALVFLGNLFLYRTVEASALVYRLGGNFSIENPLHSLLWQVPCYQTLVRLTHLHEVDFDQCMWGAPSMEPTRVASSHELLTDLRLRCDGQHRHVTLKGKVWSDQFQRVVFRTKLAQEYPWRMCLAMANGITIARTLLFPLGCKI